MNAGQDLREVLLMMPRGIPVGGLLTEVPGHPCRDSFACLPLLPFDCVDGSSLRGRLFIVLPAEQVNVLWPFRNAPT